MIFSSEAYRAICKEYEQSSNGLIFYWKNSEEAPLEARKRYQFALIALRRFLDENGLRMPIPKKRYDARDTRTWRHFG